MVCFRISAQLEEVSCQNLQDQAYIAVINLEEAKQGLIIHPDNIPPFQTARFSKAEVRGDFLCGTICIPERDKRKERIRFAYVIRQEGILLIDNSNLHYRCCKN